MKKLLALFLSAILCLSLVSCGEANDQNGSGQDTDNNNNEDTAKHDIYLKKGENGVTYIVFPNPKVFQKYVVRVEITKDNWHEYFEDYEYTEHVVKTNDFGDIEEEYDAIHVGFGLKRNLLGLADTVSFKFDGMTQYRYSTFIKKGEESNVKYEVYTANQASYGVYDFLTDERIEEKQLEEDQVKEYYLQQLKYKRDEDGVHFGNHRCIDAIGVLYVIDLPEGIYNGEDVSQIEWASGGGASLCIANLERYFES